MSAGLNLNPDGFIELLRKKGILRFARYDFQAKILLPLVDTALCENSSKLGERCQTYLKSVLALGRLAPAVRSRLEGVKASINPRSFKTYLVTIDRLFREECRKDYLLLGSEKVFASWRSFSKEELADAFSYYYSLLLKKRAPTISDLNHLVTAKVSTEFYFEQLAELAKIIRFREAEMLVESFPYRAILAGRSTVVEPEHDEFEKCVRWGYICYAEQRDADIWHFDPRSECENTPQNKSAAVHTMHELATLFVDRAGDRAFELIEGPCSRVRIHLPVASKFREVFAREGALLEEYHIVRDALKSLFVTFDQLRSKQIHKSITLYDVVKFQRFGMFICMALQEFCRRRNLLGTTTYFRSLVPHFTEEAAFAIARDFCGVSHPEELYELLCAEPDGTGVFDLLYRPVLKLAGQFLIPIGVIAHSNIIRNALQAKQFRFDATDAVDPVTDFLVAAFKCAGVRAVPRTKYNHDGEKGEIDVLTVVGNHLFAFECKNSLHPCNIHELRQSCGYIKHGFEQLARFRGFFKDLRFVRSIQDKTGLDIRKVTGLTTCVVTGNKMLIGYEEDRHSVRHIHELANVITGGRAEFKLPRTLTKPNGSGEIFRLNYWRGDSLQAADLIEYLGVDSGHRMALDAMVEHDHVIPFGQKELRFRSFSLDAQIFVDRLRQHHRVQVESVEG